MMDNILSSASVATGAVCVAREPVRKSSFLCKNVIPVQRRPEGLRAGR